MEKKEKRIAIGGLFLSVFLVLCAVINFFSGHIGAAIGSLGAGIFYCLSFRSLTKEYKK